MTDMNRSVLCRDVNEGVDPIFARYIETEDCSICPLFPKDCFVVHMFGHGLLYPLVEDVEKKNAEDPSEPSASS